MSDSHLITRAQSGDIEALASLIHEHYPFLKKYVLKLTMNPTLTDDIVQDTMLRSMEKIQTYNGTTKFSSWLITIATRLYMDRLRRLKVERRYEEESIRSLRYQMQTDNVEWFDTISILNNLAVEYRIPILLKHYYGYSYGEIGAMINVREGTVKSRVHYGLEQIRKELKTDV